MKEEEKKAVGYIRVSTEEQSAKGVSIEAQEEKIRAYCALKDIQIVSICIDKGVSGSKKLETREAGREMIYLLNEKKANMVVAYKLDRLFRDAEDALHVTKRWDEQGITLHLIDMGGQAIDTSTAVGRFFLNMLAGFAELERNLIAERTKMALEFKKANKKVYSSLPFGFDCVGDDLVENAQEQEIIREIFQLHSEGFSLNKIAETLNKRNVQTKKGGKWYASTVKNILENSLHEEVNI
ncbi:MAG: recombinase family protein [Acutalibacteraceae bacterium]